MKYSKGWAILSEACMSTTRRRMSEGLVVQCILARKLTFWCRKGSLGGMAALVLGVLELMAKHNAPRLTGLVEMIRG
jgi:hypothetical protein